MVHVILCRVEEVFLLYGASVTHNDFSRHRIFDIFIQDLPVSAVRALRG